MRYSVPVYRGNEQMAHHYCVNSVGGAKSSGEVNEGRRSINGVGPRCRPAAHPFSAPAEPIWYTKGRSTPAVQDFYGRRQFVSEQQPTF